jgi:hypothetical protein
MVRHDGTVAGREVVNRISARRCEWPATRGEPRELSVQSVHEPWSAIRSIFVGLLTRSILRLYQQLCGVGGGRGADGLMVDWVPDGPDSAPQFHGLVDGAGC